MVNDTSIRKDDTSIRKRTSSRPRYYRLLGDGLPFPLSYGSKFWCVTFYYIGTPKNPPQPALGGFFGWAAHLLKSSNKCQKINLHPEKPHISHKVELYRTKIGIPTEYTQNTDRIHRIRRKCVIKSCNKCHK